MKKTTWKRFFIKSKNTSQSESEQCLIEPKEPILKDSLPTYPQYLTLTNGYKLMVAWYRYQSVLSDSWDIENIFFHMNRTDIKTDPDAEYTMLSSIAPILNMTYSDLDRKINSTQLDQEKLIAWWAERIYQSQLKNYKRCVKEAIEWALENDKFFEIATLVQALHGCEDDASKALLALLYSDVFADTWSAYLSPAFLYSEVGEKIYLPARKKLNILEAPLLMYQQRHPLDILCGHALVSTRLLRLYRLTYELQLAENNLLMGFPLEAEYCVRALHGNWRGVTLDQKEAIAFQTKIPNVVNEPNVSVTRHNIKSHVEVLADFKKVCHKSIITLLEQTLMFGDLQAVYCYFLLVQLDLDYIQFSIPASVFDQEALEQAVKHAYNLVSQQLKLTQDMPQKHPGVGHIFYGYALHNAKIFLEKVAHSCLDKDIFFQKNPGLGSSFLRQYMKENAFGRLKYSYQLQKMAYDYIDFAETHQQEYLGIELNSFPETCDRSSLFAQRDAKSLKELKANYKHELTAYEAQAPILFFRSY